MAKKPSSKRIDKKKVAAIAAVLAHVSEQKTVASGSVLVPGASGRENWKMAGRSERLGIGPFEKVFTRKV